MPLINRRKKIIINPKLQYSFLFFSLLLAFISISVFYFSSLYFFWKFEQTGYSVGIPEGHIFYRFISEQRSLMNLILLVTIPIISIITCLIGIKMSHRVSGPIYQLIKHLEEITTTNEFKEVRFRQEDYFMELQQAFNNFIKNIGRP